MAFFCYTGVIAETLLSVAELAVDPEGCCDGLFGLPAVYWEHHTRREERFGSICGSGHGH